MELGRLLEVGVVDDETRGAALELLTWLRAELERDGTRGARFALAFHAAGLSMTEVGRRLDVTRVAVSQWLAGRYVPTAAHVDWMERLARGEAVLVSKARTGAARRGARKK